jgi:hypothetical protein
MKLFLATLVLHNFFMSTPGAFASEKHGRAMASVKERGKPSRAQRGPAQVMEPESTKESRAMDELRPFYSKAVSGSDLLGKIQGKIPENLNAFLKGKLSFVKNESFSIEKMGQKEFLVKTNSMMAHIYIDDLDQGRFQINRQTVNLDFKANPEVLWKKLNLALNIQEKTSLFELLLLERAHAFGFAGLLLGLAVVGLIGYMYNQSNCSQYDSFASQCALAQSGSQAVNTADLYYEARSFDSSWSTLALGCSSSKEQVRACIPRLSNQINTTRSSSLTVQ